MNTKNPEKIFDSELMPLFAKKMGAVHYTWDMFTNLARTADTQDDRLEVAYWEKKSKAGQECYDMWQKTISLESVSMREEELTTLVDRLQLWYNKESAMGLVENPKSKGAGMRQAKKSIAADIGYLNKHCPNASPWTIKSAGLLLEERETDSVLIAGIKSSFLRLYINQDENGLSLWDSERKWFYKNKKKIDSFVKTNNDGDTKLSMLKLLKFSDKYDEDYRLEFGR